MRIYDISRPLRVEMPIYPGDVSFVLEPVLRIGRGQVCNLSKLTLGTHTGTHMDAPWHFNDSGARIHEIALERLIGNAYVADLRGHEAITAKALEQADIPGSCTRLLLKTDNERLWSSPNFQQGFVYLAESAAGWILEREIDLIGIDYLSVEQFGAAEPVVHWKLCGASVLIVEGLDLSEVPAGEYELICLPLKIEGADGSPVRAVLQEKI
jgi:arylformamidase